VTVEFCGLVLSSRDCKLSFHWKERQRFLTPNQYLSLVKKRLDFRLEEFELEILEDYCAVVGRTKSDVLRELIRKLKIKKKPS
jgi:hypothetical protein